MAITLIFGAFDEKTKIKTNQPKQTDKTPNQIKTKTPNLSKTLRGISSYWKEKEQRIYYFKAERAVAWYPQDRPRIVQQQIQMNFC